VRSIDAVHLATALSIGDIPEVFITYDKALTRAAEKATLTVIAPA
jgi:predicted nucleic acid-binding protein